MVVIVATFYNRLLEVRMATMAILLTGIAEVALLKHVNGDVMTTREATMVVTGVHRWCSRGLPT